MDVEYCERCGEPIKYDDYGCIDDEIAEIVDKEGNHLIIHQSCMLKNDSIA